MKRLRLFKCISFLLMLIVMAMTIQSQVMASPDWVNDVDTMGASSPASKQDVYAEIAELRAGNYLNTPKSYAKLSYSKATGNSFSIQYCRPGVDRNCDGSTRYKIYVKICAINAAENNIRGESYCHEFASPAPGVSILIPSHVVPEVSTQNPGRYNYRAQIGFRIPNEAPPAQPVHAFRLRAVNGRAGFFNHATYGENLPIAIQNRNRTYNVTNATHKDTLTIRFRVPCVSSSSVPTSFTIKWKDADATSGSMPYNPDIGWTMKVGSKTLTSTQFATSQGQTHGNYMGGSDHNSATDRSQTVTRGTGTYNFNYNAGEIIEWTWTNVLANNGVQFQVPFDDANIITGCSPTQQYKGECTVSAPERVAIGQTFSASFTATNIGTEPWILDQSTVHPNHHVGLGTSSDIDNNRWSKTRSYMTGGDVWDAGAYGLILDPGKTASWTDTDRFVPTGLSPGTYRFSWRIFKASPSPVFTTMNGGGECSVDIEVYDKTNYPYVRATTNDVLAGALFKPSGSLVCSFRDPENSIAANARLRTYNMAALTGYDRSVVFVGRLFHTVLGRQADGPDGEFWIGQNYTVDASDERTINRLLGAAISNERAAPSPGSPGSLGGFFNQTTKVMSSSSYNSFITQLYLNAFGRSPESSGLTYWVGQLPSGSADLAAAASVIHYFITTSDGATFSLNSGGANSYGGSGSEYGVFSTGLDELNGGLKGFTGSNGRVRAANGGQSFRRYDLVFSNNALATSQDDEEAEGDYGSFSSTPYCLDNYYDYYNTLHTQANIPANTITTTGTTGGNATRDRIQAIPAGTQAVIKSNAPITLPATTISGDKDITLIVDGDVTINGAITYSGYGTGATPTIPQFKLIARNITINAGVAQIDGVYIAQPRITVASGLAQYDSSGIIQTCSAKQQTPNGTCAATQLTVNGSLIARRLRLYRTYGSLGASYNGASDTMADIRCAALGDYKHNNPSGNTYLYHSDTGKINVCAAERVDSSAERYIPVLLNRQPNAAAQSFRVLPPIY